VHALVEALPVFGRQLLEGRARQVDRPVAVVEVELPGNLRCQAAIGRRGGLVLEYRADVDAPGAGVQRADAPGFQAAAQPDRGRKRAATLERVAARGSVRRGIQNR